jgi:hypothetical protein
MRADLTHGQIAHQEREAFRAEDAEIIAEIAEAIKENCATWERGESASPSDLDHVLAADRILARRRTDYPGSTPEGREFVADVMWDEANRKGYGPEEYAAHVVAILMEQ